MDRTASRHPPTYLAGPHGGFVLGLSQQAEHEEDVAWMDDALFAR